MVKAKILSVLLLTVGLLFAAGHAQAQNPPPPQCGDASINHDGNVDLIPLPGQDDCIIAGGITVTNGYLRIRTPNGKIQVGGNISTTSNATSSGNIVLDAARTIEVGGSVIVNNASAPAGQSGNVDIKANNIQAGAPFVIGSASSNGVAGTINVDTVNGGGSEQFFFRGGVRVRNRGDITLTLPTSISANASASKAGAIIIESVDATINLPAGTLAVNGSPGKSAGALVLMAHAITTQDGTVISASDDGTAKLNHFVNIAAETISYQGTSGLSIHSNGGGTGSTGSFVYVLPEFGIQIFDDSSTSPANFSWTVTYPFGTGNPRALTWNGASGATLDVTANGDSNTQLLMSGYPLTFNGGNTLLGARGQTNHRIDLTYTGATIGSNGLVVNATDLTLDANSFSTGGTGGDIFLNIPKPFISPSSQAVLATADGPANNGVQGSGGTIQFFPRGDTVLGGANGQFHLSAQSGKGGGPGGTVTISNLLNTTTISSTSAIQVSARSTAPTDNGDGGTVNITSGFLTFTGANTKVLANGVGTGKGGNLVFDVTNSFSLDTPQATRAQLTARSLGTGQGGHIDIHGGDNVTISGGDLSVAAGDTGSGGTIDLFAGSALSLTGDLKANAGTGTSSNGLGGEINLTSATLVLNGSGAPEPGLMAAAASNGQTISVDGHGSGRGGTINVLVFGSETPTNIAKNVAGAMALSADGGSQGQGGTISLNDPSAGFIIAGAAISVQGGAGQKAGNITVDAGETLSVSGILKANGTGGGDGGSVSLTSAATSTPLKFQAGTEIQTTGTNGGQIFITNTGNSGILIERIAVVSASSVNGDGTGGAIIVDGTSGDASILGTLRTLGHGTGQAGSIQVRAGNVFVGDDSSATTDVAIEATGRGDFAANGNIAITAANLFKLTDVIIRANGAASKDGGSINISGAFVLMSGGVVDASSEVNGNSGTIVITQSSSAPDANDMVLDGAKVITVGKGNNVTTNIRISSSAGLALVNDARVDSSARSTGRGGRISLEYATVTASHGFSFSSQSIVASNGGSSNGSGGRVSITGVKGGSAQVFGTIEVDSFVGGNGGRIDLNTGESTSASYPLSLSSTSQLLASGNSQTGDGGTILLTENVLGGFGPPITIGGKIIADSGEITGGGGSITFRNSGPGDLQVLGQSGSLISAKSGSLRFIKQNRNVQITAEELRGSVTATGKDVMVTITGMQPAPPTPPNVLALEAVTASAGNVQINGGDAQVIVTTRGLPQASIIATGNVGITARGITVGSGALSGNDFVQGSNITLTTNGAVDGDIILGADLKSDGDITLTTTGVGNILSNGGRAGFVTDGAFNELLLSTSSGSVGNPIDGSPFLTGVARITSAQSLGSISVENTTTNITGLEVLDVEAGRHIKITSADSDLLILGDVRSLVEGNIELAANVGRLKIQGLSQIITTEGSIDLHSGDTSENGIVELDFESFISANSPGEEGDALANVYVYRGTFPPAEVTGAKPSNTVATTHNGGEIFWGGNPSITTTGANLVCVDGAKVVFQAAGDATKIRLDTAFVIAERGGNACTQ